MNRIYNAEADIRNLKLKIITALKELAADLYKTQKTVLMSEESMEIFYKALAYISFDMGKEGLLTLLKEVQDTVEKIRGDTGMIRRIISIDAEKCNGCGACARACHEGSIDIIDGKARLTRENYCDGLGDCLPECPAGAITFQEREAPAYDEAAVLAAKQSKLSSIHSNISESEANQNSSKIPISQLAQWPCQIKLVPVSAPYFNGAELLIAADCTAYAYGNFHNDYMKGRITLIGCPKLNGGALLRRT